MSSVECGRCKKVFFVDPRMGDYIHDCSDFPSNEALANEDVVVIGNWSDYTGSGTAQGVMRQGLANSLWGTRASALGAPKVNDTTIRGANVATHRSRGHLEYIDLNNDNCI